MDTRKQDTTSEVDISHHLEEVVALVANHKVQEMRLVHQVGILGVHHLEAILGHQHHEGHHLLAIAAMLAPKVADTMGVVETTMATIMEQAAGVATPTVDLVTVEVVAAEIIRVVLHQPPGDMARQHLPHQPGIIVALPTVADLLTAVGVRKGLILLPTIHLLPSTQKVLDRTVVQLVLGQDHMVAAAVVAMVAAVIDADCSQCRRLQVGSVCAFAVHIVCGSMLCGVYGL